MNDQQHDDDLWKIAKRRSAFKRNFAVYLLVNPILVAIWYVSNGIGSYFWPIWPMLWWGAGIAFQYAAAYHNKNLFNPEKEYERLKHQQNNQL